MSINFKRVLLEGGIQMTEENGGIFGKKKFSLLRTYRLPEVWGQSDTWSPSNRT